MEQATSRRQLRGCRASGVRSPAGRPGEALGIMLVTNNWSHYGRNVHAHQMSNKPDPVGVMSDAPQAMPCCCMQGCIPSWGGGHGDRAAGEHAAASGVAGGVAARSAARQPAHAADAERQSVRHPPGDVLTRLWAAAHNPHAAPPICHHGLADNTAERSGNAACGIDL